MTRPPPRPTLFPYTTLSRSPAGGRKPAAWSSTSCPAGGGQTGPPSISWPRHEARPPSLLLRSRRHFAVRASLGATPPLFPTATPRPPPATPPPPTPPPPPPHPPPPCRPRLPSPPASQTGRTRGPAPPFPRPP